MDGPRYFSEQTIAYKTFLKSTLRDGLQAVFDSHPDPMLRSDAFETGVKVSLEWSKTRDQYPAVIIRFFEKSIQRMGVGHYEMIQVDDDDPVPTKMYHNMFNGDIEFGIYALSNLDRDVMADTIVQTITMGVLEGYTNSFFTAVYGDESVTPAARWEFINLASDKISGFGETQTPVPWGAEDDQLYLCQYRVGVSGEFYSHVPDDRSGEFVTAVPIYPYVQGLEAAPNGLNDPAAWM